jgi:hypothetical protein
VWGWENYTVAGRTRASIPKKLFEFYEFHEWRNAIAVLRGSFPREWRDILEALDAYRILRSDIGEVGEKGGGISKVALRMDRLFRERQWKPQEFDISTVVRTAENVQTLKSATHKVDSFKSKIVLEVEWNNKSEFYDRNLNNFRLLFDLGVADVGVVITRCDEMQKVFNSLGKGRSYGSTTTILSKLKRKLDAGAGGGCPVLAVGMKSTLYLDDITDPSVSSGFVPIARITKKRRTG